METIQIDQTAAGHPIDHPTGITGLSFDIFATLSSMCGNSRFTLPSHDEIESLLSNLDLFTNIEYEHMLAFIRRFLARIASATSDNIRYYLNNLNAGDTIEHFFDSLGHEIDLAHSAYYGANQFESLFAVYLLGIEREEAL
jgi:hypothetical protein